MPIVQEAGWAPGPVWTGAENLAPTGIRYPDRPVHSQLLCGLRYRPTIFCNIIEFCFKDEPFFLTKSLRYNLYFIESTIFGGEKQTFRQADICNVPIYEPAPLFNAFCARNHTFMIFLFISFSFSVFVCLSTQFYRPLRYVWLSLRYSLYVSSCRPC